MNFNNAYERPRYTDYEVSKMIKNKLEEQQLSINDVAAEFGVNEDYIAIMTSGENHYSKNMLEIASKILEIKFDELVAIDVDPEEVSCRQTVSAESNEFLDMFNYIFNELIMQRKFSVE